MWDEDVCRGQVMEILEDTSKRQMCNLRTELFLVAANSPFIGTCLIPFPSCFFDTVTKTKRIDDLKAKIGQIPKLSEINDSTVMDNQLWKLLHWVFTNPVNIQPVLANSNTLENWQQETGLVLNTIHLQNCQLFTVMNPRPKKGFIEGKSQFGTKFGFHGSRLENFHSVIHRGLISSLNKRSTYGTGTYLSTLFDISFRYARSSWEWTNSEIGSGVRCVAICEFVNDPSIITKNFPSRLSRSTGKQIPEYDYYVIPNDEFMQLSHLLVMFTEN